MDKKNNDNFKRIRLMHLAMSVGISIIVWVAIGFFLGRWLDERLGTEPWLMILGILAGIGLSFYGFARDIIVLENIEKKEQAAEKDDKK